MSRFYNLLNKSRKIKNRFRSKEEMEKSQYSPELSYSEEVGKRRDIQTFFKFARKYMEDNPELSNEEVKQQINELLVQIRGDIANLPSLRSDSIRVDITEYFKNNKRELLELYNELIEKEKQTGKPLEHSEIYQYSISVEEAKRQYIEYLVSTYRINRKILVENGLDENLPIRLRRASPKDRRAILENFSKSSRDAILETLKYFSDKESDGILELFDANQNMYSSDLKRNYIKSIKSCLNIIDKYGVMGKYLEQYNKQMDFLKLPELKTSIEEIKDSYGNLDDNYMIRHLDFIQLSSINSFWINRLAKEIDGLNYGYFVTDSFDLWDKIRKVPIINEKNNKEQTENDLENFSENTKLDVPLDNNVYSAIDEKMRFLQNIFSYCFESESKKINLSELEQEEITDYTTGKKMKRVSAVNIDFDKYLYDIYDDIQDDYEKYFSRINDGVFKDAGNNDFLDDFIKFSTGENIREVLYNIKDNVLNAQLFFIFNQRSNIKNWGIYLEEDEKNIENKNMILLALDINGLNMPVRLHIPKSKLMEFIKANNCSEFFPIYQGESDFVKKRYAGKTISTPILMPTTENYKQKIGKALERENEDSNYYKFLKHLEALTIPGAIPDHLKDTITEKKKSKKTKGKKGSGPVAPKVKKVFRNRYYNLLDNKIYVERKNIARSTDTQYDVDDEYLR